MGEADGHAVIRSPSLPNGGGPPEGLDRWARPTGTPSFGRRPYRMAVGPRKAWTDGRGRRARRHSVVVPTEWRWAPGRLGPMGEADGHAVIRSSSLPNGGGPPEGLDRWARPTGTPSFGRRPYRMAVGPRKAWTDGRGRRARRHSVVVPTEWRWAPGRLGPM